MRPQSPDPVIRELQELMKTMLAAQPVDAPVESQPEPDRPDDEDDDDDSDDGFETKSDPPGVLEEEQDPFPVPPADYGWTDHAGDQAQQEGERQADQAGESQAADLAVEQLNQQSKDQLKEQLRQQLKETMQELLHAHRKIQQQRQLDKISTLIELTSDEEEASSASSSRVFATAAFAPEVLDAAAVIPVAESPAAAALASATTPTADPPAATSPVADPLQAHPPAEQALEPHAAKVPVPEGVPPEGPRVPRRIPLTWQGEFLEELGNPPPIDKAEVDSDSDEENVGPSKSSKEKEEEVTEAAADHTKDGTKDA